jgi:hypothetical protein
LERKIEHLTRQVKGDKKLLPVLELAQALRHHLDQGHPISRYSDQDHEAFDNLSHEMQFLTAKPVIYAANVDEDGLEADNVYVRVVREVAAEHGAEVVKLCAQLEAELAGMSEEERLEFLQLAGIETDGLNQIIRQSFDLLGLINYFSFNEEEVRAWTISQGWTAPKAAGVIHTDFERGFIRAEVIPYDTFVKRGSWAAVKAAGEMRLEGKEYVVQDGDVIYFRFNV